MDTGLFFSYSFDIQKQDEIAKSINDVEATRPRSSVKMTQARVKEYGVV